jgi:hypothetical protein
MLNTPVKLAAEDEAGTLIARILASDAFRRSPRLRALFQYLAEHSLNEDRGLLSEQQVGIAVFCRPPGYNATEDSVVRVQIHNLRERLAEYFAGEGASEPLVATIPKGRYSLIFRARTAVAGLESVREPKSRLQTGQRSPAWTWALLSVLAFMLGIAADRLWTKAASPLPSTVKELPVNPVLGSVLTPLNETIVVIEDTMLVSAAMLRGGPFSLTEYLSGAGRAPELGGVFSREPVRKRLESLIPKARYVNLANVTFATRLLRSYPRLSEKVAFRHPREIQLRDIRSSNCILFGGQLSNPWIDLYEDRVNFHLRTFPEGSGFENRHPKPGERSVYGDADGADKPTYARIVLLPNFELGTRALILTGMGGAETEATAQLLLAPNFMEQLPPELRSQLGVMTPYLEILISASRVGISVGRTQVVAWRTSEDAGPSSDNR